MQVWKEFATFAARNSKTFIQMRKFIILLLALALLSCKESKNPQRDSEGRILKNGQFYDSQEAETHEVWICMGKKSHAYHSNDECYGIKACKSKVMKVSLEEAISSGRTPCHYCHEETVAYNDDEECEDCEKEKDPYDPDYYDPLEDPDVKKYTNENGEIVVEIVYVCIGSGSTKYHRYTDCSGLNSCSGDIEELYVPEAEYKGYEPCKRCY